jgi:hypothetical protein
MPDDATPNPPPVQVINQPTGPVGLNGSMGLSGWLFRVGNTTAMAIIAGAFLWLLNQQTTAARVDRLDDRQLFRDSVKALNDEANRHTGELRGSMDVNTAVLRDLIAELKAARHEGRVPQSLPPKAAELRPPGGP